MLRQPIVVPNAIVIPGINVVAAPGAAVLSINQAAVAGVSGSVMSVSPQLKEDVKVDDRDLAGPAMYPDLSELGKLVCRHRLHSLRVHSGYIFLSPFCFVNC